MAIKMNDRQNKICYICGKPGAKTKDHIPPKNIYLKHLRSIGDDLITVPAHEECNGKYSKDDEHFRFFLSIPGYWNSEHARELWDNEIYRGLQKPEAKKFKKYIISLMEPIELKSPSGIYLGDSAMIKIDSIRIENVIERIARGVFYHEMGNIMPLDNKLIIHYLDPKFSQERGALPQLTKSKTFADETFRYWWNFAEDSPTSGFFWFTFFDAVDFAVLAFAKADWDKRPHLKA